MKIKVYRTNKKVPISQFILNLSEEAQNWKKLNKILRARITPDNTAVTNILSPFYLKLFFLSSLYFFHTPTITKI